MAGDEACCMLVKIGTVKIAPSAPNSIMHKRRPMRSDSMPNNGCMHM